MFQPIQLLDRFFLFSKGINKSIGICDCNWIATLIWTPIPFSSTVMVIFNTVTKESIYFPFPFVIYNILV